MITSIEIEGFKSLKDRCKVDFKGLTILAGANSSGKSSVMQPLLLFKQTLEATYDPGILKLDGPNVLFESFDNFLLQPSHKSATRSFRFSLKIDGTALAEWDFSFNPRSGLKIKDYSFDKDFELNFKRLLLRRLASFFSSDIKKQNKYKESLLVEINKLGSFRIYNDTDIEILDPNFDRFILKSYNIKRDDINYEWAFDDNLILSNNIKNIIHVPGIRNRPERQYKITGTDSVIGTFDNYSASIVYNWQSINENINGYKLSNLIKYLSDFSLTGVIIADKISDTAVSLKVSPLPSKSVPQKQLVDISDVGYGVSQVLPVLVALIEAKEGQMVYIEQPELHLHPNAQYLLAQPFVDAVNRGVNVVMETHSSILLLAIQTAVANGELDPDKVSLNWFERNPDTGFSTHTIGQLGSDGGFGEWPVDFDDVELKAARMFIEAQNRKA